MDSGCALFIPSDDFSETSNDNYDDLMHKKLASTVNKCDLKIAVKLPQTNLGSFRQLYIDRYLLRTKFDFA